MRCVCSETGRLLVKVTPRILITVTRLIFGSGGGAVSLVSSSVYYQQKQCSGWPDCVVALP